MKLLHLADLHAYGRNGLADLARVLLAAATFARDRAVDAIIIAGDLFEGASRPEERLTIMGAVQTLAGAAPVHVVKGNHDRPGDVEALSYLASDHPITVRETIHGHLPGEADMVGPFAVLSLPWVDKSWLVANAPPSATKEETDDAAVRALHAILDGFRANAAMLREHELPVVLAAHVMVGGSRVSTGQVLQGLTVELSPTDLSGIDADYCALGHIHQFQEWPGGVVYAGSPRAQDFGETDPKGWVLVEVNPDTGLTSWQHHVGPDPGVATIDLDLRGTTEWSVNADDVPPGARVRVRVKVNATDPVVNRARIRDALLAVGASDVVVEVETIHQQAVRVEGAANVRTAWELVELYLAQTDLDVTDEQRERLRLKLSELEGAA